MARPKSDIQERILEAAHRRFLAEGVDAASLRNIAKDAETSIGMVYYYYTTKDELFLAVVEETYQQLMDELEVELRRGTTFEQRVFSLYLRAGAATPREAEVVRLIVREVLTSHERRERLLKRFLRGHLPVLLRVIVDGLEAGELNRDIHPLIAMACTIAIGAVPTVMLKVANERRENLQSSDEIPVFFRFAVEELFRQLPTPERLAQILTTIAVRALGETKKP